MASGLAGAGRRRSERRAFGALLCAGLAAPAGAAEGLRATVAWTSDYIVRGVSLSDRHGAAQAGLTYSHPAGGYVGVWGSSIDSANDSFYPVSPSAAADSEIDAFAGYARRLTADWTVDVKAAAYLYPNDPSPVSYNYVEFSVGTSWRERLTVNAAVSPSTTVLSRATALVDRVALDANVAWAQPLGHWVTGSLGIGHRELAAAGLSGYDYASASLATQGRHWSVALGHFRTDDRARRLFGERLAGARTTVTLAVQW